MTKKGFGAIVAMLAVTTCDALSTLKSDDPQANEMAADANARTADGRVVADAGITRSRSLGGLNGAAGGKDPAVATAGVIPSGVTFPPELLVGRWTDDGNCKLAVEIRSDGMFESADGVVGNWALEGDVLTVSAGDATSAMRLRAIDADTVETINADGSIGRSTRC